MNVHIVMHESFEAPAAIETWALHRGFNVAYTRLYEGETFPSGTQFDLLVVMGGPQSPDTTVAQCAHFDSPKELAFIRDAISNDKFVLGVCLGAQMIGEAFGAKYEHSPHREVGVFPVTLTEAGKVDLIVSKFPETFRVGHWHGDMPGLTSDSEVLATSEGCPRQIVRYTPKVYGFQCHFEFTPEAMEQIIEQSSAYLEESAGQPFVESPEEMRSHDYAEMNRLLYKFLDDFVAQ